MFTANDIFTDFVSALPKVESLEELNLIYGTALRKMGFDKYAYQIVRDPAVQNNEKPTILANYPEKWVEYYIDQEYQKIDPVITEGLKQVEVFQWSEITARIEMSRQQKEFFHEADDFGIGAGLGIPILGNSNSLSMVSLVSAEKDRELKKIFIAHENTIHILSLYYHTNARDLITRGQIMKQAEENPLTERERECLLWASRGKTSWETSVLLNVSERTVIFHLENAKQKLGVYSKQHAVVTAVMKSYINP